MFGNNYIPGIKTATKVRSGMALVLQPEWLFSKFVNKTKKDIIRYYF